MNSSKKEARSQKIIDKLFLVAYAYVAWTAGWAWVGSHIDASDSLVYAEVVAVFVLVITGLIVTLKKAFSYINEVRQLKIDIIYLEVRLSKSQST